MSVSVSVMSQGLLLVSVIWPLVVAGLVVLPRSRPAGFMLIPWAALPALVLSACPANTMTLSGVMLGGMLSLEPLARVFLFLTAILWLAGSTLARARLRSSGSIPLAVMWLLAMAGNIGLVLAQDALWFFAAATVAGYSLYGVLVNGADWQTHKAGRVLIVLLVLSDLLVFDALLILAQAAGSTDFLSLRQALVSHADTHLLLGLFIVGFGIKIGLLGVHFWVPSVFARAGAELQTVMVAFMLGAGLLGILRLIPLGQALNAQAGATLQWLGWASLLHAGFIGTLRHRQQSISGYVVLALNSVWLVLLSACLYQPALWKTVSQPSAVVLVQSGTALVAVLLVDRIVESAPFRRGFRWVEGLAWLAVFLLAMAPLGLVQSTAGAVPEISILASMAVIAWLAGNQLFRRHFERAAQSESDKVLFTPLWVSGMLMLVAIFSAGYQFLHLTPKTIATGLFTVLGALLMVPLSARWLEHRTSTFPSIVLLQPITQGAFKVRTGLTRFLVLTVERSAHYAQALKRQLQPLKRASDNIIGWLEPMLFHWTMVLSLLLLLGLWVAWVAGSI